MAIFEASRDADAAERALAGRAGVVTLTPDQAREVEPLLTQANVPDGEARYYAHACAEGSTLVMVPVSSADYATVRELLLRCNGSDVQSRGAELARGEGSPTGSRRPIDITRRWKDVASRYQMLWQQHYGTSDMTWESIEPAYRFAFAAANRADLRGQTWDAVQAGLRRDWESQSGALAWSEVAGPMRDVWDDVADEAASAEGGRDRNIATPGTEQTLSARSLRPR